MSSHPEPGYESMDHFSINVDHVAEMLRTIEFQAGKGSQTALPWASKGRPGGCKVGGRQWTDSIGYDSA